jgi:Mg2+ and Co2+ transporter CorA
VHALLDLLVDRIFDVVDEYHTRILALEHAVLLRPNMRAVRAAHVLQADLARHRRTLEPLRTVVHGLRRHDAERAGASAGPGHDTGGYMSHKARIYLADVVDHLEYILASVEMFAGTTESLMDYTFNVRALMCGRARR